MDTNEIKLTIKNNTTTSGIAFPITPRPEVRDDGIFPPRKEDRTLSWVRLLEKIVIFIFVSL